MIISEGLQDEHNPFMHSRSINVQLVHGYKFIL
jgi:hypothetical protein